ncbi:MAG: IS110 family transposase [Parcubacteria group bacterium]
MTLPQSTLGIDVSGKRLDAHAHPAGRARSFANDREGIARLVAWAGELEAFVVLEATAPWDQPLVRALEASGLRFHRANPGRARDFARAAGLLAKTDALDARMLALYGAGLPLEPTAPVEPERLALQRLNARRDQLVEMRKGERTRARAELDPLVADSVRAVTALLDQQIRRIEQHIQALLAEPALRGDHDILRSAPGVGPVAAGVLLAHLPELGRVNRRQVAALAGLAPVARDSGLMRGRRHVRGGRKRVRDALYMAALAAIRTAPWKAAFQAMTSAGKPAKLAIIAIARRLLVALNAAIRQQQPFHTHPA